MKQLIKQTNNNGNNKNKNDNTIEFSIKTQLILLTQQKKQTNILLQLSLFPLKQLQLALGIDENNFQSKLNENQQKIMAKQPKELKYEALALLAQQQLMQKIRKDCKSSFKSWKYAQFVSYFNLIASRTHYLNVEQQLQKISEAEEALSTSNIGHEFYEELNYKILKLIFILEKIRIWIQMGDFIKSVKTFLVNEEYLNQFNYIEDKIKEIQKNDIENKGNLYKNKSFNTDKKEMDYNFKDKQIKSEFNDNVIQDNNIYQLNENERKQRNQNQKEIREEREEKKRLEEMRKFEWILLIKSQIYITYAFTMQKVKEYQRCIHSYERYIQIKEIIHQNQSINQFSTQIYKSQQQKNAYYSLYVYFFYKYCKALIHDKQEEKALQSVYKIQQFLELNKTQQLIKESEANVFSKKFTLLTQKIEDLFKNKVVNRMQKQNDFLFINPLKFEDQQFKQIKMFCKMSKANELENKLKSQESNSADYIQEIEQDELKEEQINESKDLTLHRSGSFQKQSSFFGSEAGFFNKLLDDSVNIPEQDVLEKTYTEEDENLFDKYTRIVKDKNVIIEGITNQDRDKELKKQITPLGVLLAQSEIAMNTAFNMNKYNYEQKQKNGEQLNQTKLFKQETQNNLIPFKLNLKKLNTTNTMQTQPDSRRISAIHSETARYRNSSLFSQNSQMYTSDYVSELHTKRNLKHKGKSVHLLPQNHDPMNFNRQQSQDNTALKDKSIEKNNLKSFQQTPIQQIKKVQSQIQISAKQKNIQEEDQNQYTNIYKKEYLRVYSNGKRSSSGNLFQHIKNNLKYSGSQQIQKIDRQILSNLEKNKNVEQSDNQRVKLSSKLYRQTAPNSPVHRIQTVEAERNDKLSMKNNPQYLKRQRTNYELIKDLDIELELQYLIGSNNTQTDRQYKLNQSNKKFELNHRPVILKNNFEFKQDYIDFIDSTDDSNLSNIKAVNKDIPNIMNMIKECKENQKIDKITDKYINLAKTDTVLRKKMNQITLENVFGKSDKNKSNIAQSQLIMALNTKNQFMTGLQKLNDEQKLHIKKFGGVVYNEKKEDFEFIQADKYGVGFMNQDLEEKIKSVKEELKKIQIIPPQPPTKQEISFETDTESVNMTNVDLNQENAIIQRFKLSLENEMNGINEKDMFVNHSLNEQISKQSVVYRSQYKSSFQRYAKKDFYVNSIAQHNITILKQDLEVDDQSNNSKLFKNSNFESQKDCEEQKTDEEEENDNEENQDNLMDIQADLSKQLSNRKDMEYSYSLVDNLSDLNKSSLSYSNILPQLQQSNTSGRNSQRKRGGSIFRIYNETPLKRGSRALDQPQLELIQQDQAPSTYIPILQNILSPRNSEKGDTSVRIEETKDMMQSSLSSRFQRYTKEKKLSLMIGQQAENNNNNDNELIVQNISNKPYLSHEENQKSPKMDGNILSSPMKLNFSGSLNKLILTKNLQQQQQLTQKITSQSNQQRQTYKRNVLQKHNTDYWSDSNVPKQKVNSPSPLFRQTSINLLLNKSSEEEQGSPSPSPYTLKSVFSKFKADRNKEDFLHIIESPIKIQESVLIQGLSNHSEENETSKFQLSKRHSQSETPSNSVFYQKQQINKQSLFKLKLQRAGTMAKQPKKLIEEIPSIFQKQATFQDKNDLISETDLSEDENEQEIEEEEDKIQEELIQSQKIVFSTQKILLQTKEDIQLSRQNSQELQNFLKDYGFKNLLSARLFSQKIKQSKSGAVNNQSGPFMKFYPPFKFTRLIQGKNSIIVLF